MKFADLQASECLYAGPRGRAGIQHYPARRRIVLLISASGDYTDVVAGPLLSFQGEGATCDQEYTRGNRALRDASIHPKEVVVYTRIAPNNWERMGHYAVVAHVRRSVAAKMPPLVKASRGGRMRRWVIDFTLWRTDAIPRTPSSHATANLKKRLAARRTNAIRDKS